jgi:type IV secretory pathway TraG/TraD family ATPase VirD4
MLTDLQQALSQFGGPDLTPYQRWLDAYGWPVGLGAAAALIGAAVLTTRPRRQTGPQGYGTAHVATDQELRRYGLYARRGTFVGQAYGRNVRVPRSHLVIIGPSECGKTHTNLWDEAEWPGSYLTLDPKGQHQLYTAVYRQEVKRNVIHTFEPRHRSSGHINVLDAVPWGEGEEVTAVQRITSHVTDLGDAPLSGGALFYQSSNRSILEAVCLYEGNFHPPASFARTRYAMRDMPGMLARMAKTDHPLVKPAAVELLGLPLAKRNELWKSARECLRVFDDPILAENTDDSTIHLDTLQHGEQPQTVYIRVTPDDAQGPLRSFLRLLLDQHIAAAGHRRDITHFRHHERMNLEDQFLLGYLRAADDTGAFYREHGLWLTSVFQSFEQLASYRSYAGLLDNSKTWVVFRPQGRVSAEIISQKLGEVTAKDPHVTRARGRVSHTTVWHQRRLMTPWEVEHIPDYTTFVFAARDGVPPLFTRQVPFPLGKGA